MAVEMASFRLMAPFFGNSIIVWTNILGIIMIALALGYYIGGKIADKYPNPKIFFKIVITGSLLVLAIPFFGKPPLEVLSLFINHSLIGSSFAASLVLFLIPFILFGTISPYLIRLSNKLVKKTGSVAGTIFAYSTIGSIIGTFLPTLVTVPIFGVKRTIILFGAILCINAAIGLGKKTFYLLLVPFLLTGLWGSKFTSPSTRDTIAQAESPYNYLEIFKDKYENMYLIQNNAMGIQSMYSKNTVLTHGKYWDFFNIIPIISETQKQDIAIIGLAGGIIPRQFDYFFKKEYDLQIDGVEIDPQISKLAKEYFKMDYQNLNIINQDGRNFLRQTEKKYDAIIVDAYHEFYIPQHLSSDEFFKITKSKLKENGVIAMNFNAADTESEVFQRYIATIKNSYEHVGYMHIPESYNYLILGTNADDDILSQIKNIETKDPELRKIVNDIKRNMIPSKKSSEKLITDDLPLSEILIDKMYLENTP